MVLPHDHLISTSFYIFDRSPINSTDIIRTQIREIFEPVLYTYV